MQLYADKKKNKPVRQNLGLAGYLNPQDQEKEKKAANMYSFSLPRHPDPVKSSEPAKTPPRETKETTQPANTNVAPSERLMEMGLVPYPDPSRPDDSPFVQAEERYQRAVDATGQMAKVGALAQTFSAIADAATMLSGGDGPVAVGHDRTGAQLSHDAANRMQHEDMQFQQGLQEHFNMLFQHQQQKDQVKQANVQMLNQETISESQETIRGLREALENYGEDVPENIRQAEQLINLARSAAGTDRGNKLATHYMEQAQRLGVFDEELNLNPEFFDAPSLTGRGQVPGFTETGEVDQNSPQAFDLMQAEVSISDFQRFNDELQEVERKISEEREKEVPDEGTLDRLQEQKSNLESRITSLRDNEYVQRWDVQNRYQQLQQDRKGAFRDQQFDFMHGQRGRIDHDRLLDMSYEQAMRSLEGESPDMERTQDYISSVRRGKFQQGGLSFEQAGPHLERIDNLLEQAGYDQQQRRGALNRIIKEDFGIEMDSGDPGSEQGEQTKAQEASIFRLPGSGQAGDRDEPSSPGTDEAAGFEGVDFSRAESTDEAIDQHIPRTTRPAAKRMARHARVMSINRGQFDHDNEDIAQRARGQYEDSKEKLEEEIDRVKNLDPESQYRKELEEFVREIESFTKSLAE